AYDPAGRLSTITDFDGNVTTVERDSNGNFTGVVGPYGQRLTVTTNPDGYMTSATTPGGRTTRYGYTPDGLLNSVIDPNGNPPQITEYDPDSGRVIQETDSGGGFVTMDRVELPNGFEVTFTTAMGRVWKSREVEAGGVITATRTDTDGTVTVSETNTLTGVTTVTEPDGTVITSTLSPDSRFGMQAPFASSGRITTGGLTANLARTRTVTLADPEDPLTVTQLVETLSTNGRTSRSTWTTANLTLVERSPASRSVTTTFSLDGKPLTWSVPGLATVTRTYTGRGQLDSLTWGSGSESRTTTYSYDSNGYFQSVTDSLGRTVTLGRDLDGRVLTTTRPDGRVVRTGYDDNSNILSVTPPGRPEHVFRYDNRNQVDLYTPPPASPSGTTSCSYNADGQPIQVLRPDGDTILSGYDATGRIQTVTYPRGTLTFTFDAGTGRLTGVSGPNGYSRTPGFQGGLLVSLASGGPVAGSESWTYDNNFRATSRSVSGGGSIETISMSYDADDRPTSAGALTLQRSAQNSQVTGMTVGAVTTTFNHNPFGEVDSSATSFGGSPLFAESCTRDRIGRINTRVETIEGQTTTWSYTYDLSGRLERVEKDGALFQQYGYDSNDNRVSVTSPGGTTVATVDDQDRLQTMGDETFAHDAAGDLLSRTGPSGTTIYDCETTGQLLGVTRPDGHSIRYELDASLKRSTKTLDGVVQRRWLYGEDLDPVAEFDGSGALRTTFFAGYLVRDGVTYRLVRDHLGSVRLVVDAATGQVAQRLDYDPWGNVTLDTNPGFQPFGYAGGLYDPDTGLVRFGAREYDPSTGRWLTKDPLGLAAGTNLYAYCNNDPINHVDPTGLQTDCPPPECEALKRLIRDALDRISDLLETAENAKRHEPRLERGQDTAGLERIERVLEEVSRLNRATRNNIVTALALYIELCEGEDPEFEDFLTFLGEDYVNDARRQIQQEDAQIDRAMRGGPWGGQAGDNARWVLASVIILATIKYLPPAISAGAPVLEAGTGEAAAAQAESIVLESIVKDILKQGSTLIRW
ncbi:MAG: RHS repeat-associated core domain-containing protein, partial [Candidatus Eremiobacterota bacterium]